MKKVFLILVIFLTGCVKEDSNFILDGSGNKNIIELTNYDELNSEKELALTLNFEDENYLVPLHEQLSEMVRTVNMDVYELCGIVSDEYAEVFDYAGEVIYSFEYFFTDSEILDFEMIKTESGYDVYYINGNQKYVALYDSDSVHVMLSRIMGNKEVYINEYVEVISIEGYSLLEIDLDGIDFTGMSQVMVEDAVPILNEITEDGEVIVMVSGYEPQQGYNFNTAEVRLRYQFGYEGERYTMREAYEQFPREIFLELLENIEGGYTEFIMILE